MFSNCLEVRVDSQINQEAGGSAETDGVARDSNRTRPSGAGVVGVVDKLVVDGDRQNCNPVLSRLRPSGASYACVTYVRCNG